MRTKQLMITGLSMASLSFFLVACGNEPAESAEAKEPATEEEVLPPAPEPFVGNVLEGPADARLKVYEAPMATQYDGARLGLQIRPDQANMSAQFDYNISGFDLKAQTPDAPERGCANSPDGQHIHFILNNHPYLAKYESSFKEAVQPGWNVLLSFLSRSYHESLKSQGNFVLTAFRMSGEGEVPEFSIYEAPTLYYSRPKGTYKVSDGTKVLLDFFVMNVTMAENGYRVRASIDGEVWVLNKWTSYFIEGLGVGEHTVQLQLIDPNGVLVDGPFNDSGPRTFTITQG